MNRHIKKVISIFKYNRKKINKISDEINNVKDNNYIVFYNPECIGVMNSIKELFDNNQIIELKEIFNKKELNNIALKIKEKGIKQVIFSTMAYGYKSLAELIYNLENSIKIKFLWHGSHSLFVNKNEEYFLDSILDLERRGIITGIGFFKESMSDFYKKKGYNSYFLKNTVNSIKLNDIKIKKDKSENIKIGLYASGDRWEKNTYNQLSACAMVKNAIVDVIPNTTLSKSFCELMKINLKSKELVSSLSRKELFERMFQNDVNLYVTFTECAPMVPLESLELGVPCIVGNNNHYFTNTELEKYLVVKSEDNIDEIYEKINLAINNKDEIIGLYKNWKANYDKESKQSVQDFLVV